MSTPKQAASSQATSHPPQVTPEMVARNKKASKAMLVVIVGMFLFGFISIPLYRLVCTTFDPGGSTYALGLVTAKDYEGVQVDTSRTVSVRMTTTVNRALPWEFKNLTNRVELNPGQRQLVKFHAKNLASVPVRGRAVYDINPPEAGQYLKKIECFCFQEQKLEPGESVEMPLVFWFEPDMPAHIVDITLAYTFFNMDISLEHTTKKAQR